MDELWMNLGLGAKMPDLGISSYFCCIFFPNVL